MLLAHHIPVLLVLGGYLPEELIQALSLFRGQVL